MRYALHTSAPTFRVTTICFRQSDQFSLVSRTNSRRCSAEYADMYGLDASLCCGVDAFKAAIVDFPQLRYMRAKGVFESFL